jgi:hypothetical protein
MDEKMKSELLTFIEEYEEEFKTSLEEWSFDNGYDDYGSCYPTREDREKRLQEIFTTIENL